MSRCLVQNTLPTPPTKRKQLCCTQKLKWFNFKEQTKILFRTVSMQDSEFKNIAQSYPSLVNAFPAVGQGLNKVISLNQQVPQLLLLCFPNLCYHEDEKYKLYHSTCAISAMETPAISSSQWFHNFESTNRKHSLTRNKESKIPRCHSLSIILVSPSIIRIDIFIILHVLLLHCCNCRLLS